MIYIRGTQEYKLRDGILGKISLTDDDGFTETPWIKRFEGIDEVVLVNEALAFVPYPSWGAILPNVHKFNFLAMLETEQLTLHPEAFDQYVKAGSIDEQGNYLLPIGAYGEEI